MSPHSPPPHSSPSSLFCGMDMWGAYMVGMQGGKRVAPLESDMMKEGWNKHYLFRVKFWNHKIIIFVSNFELY